MPMTPKTATERPRLRGLYAVTPEVENLAELVRLVRAAIEGGALLVQYRAKRLDAGRRLRQAEAIASLCRDHRVTFLVNDDIDLAICVSAQGVHLGRDDGDPRDARSRLPEAILGVSCYDEPARVLAAVQAGADYVGIGSIFASATKPDAARSGLAAIAEAKRLAAIPVAAIGGITPANAADAVAAGADMLAVISSLFAAPDVATAARALSRPFAMEPDLHVRTQPAAL